jgi:protein-S-isoprenylcysteine O-methyltransferase Ste14
VVDEEPSISAGQRAWRPSRAELALSVLFGVLFIAEIIACFYIYYNFYALTASLLIGWAVLILGLLMMTFPRYELSKWGDVPDGKSWVNTTKVVDTGIYGIVRHPLYVGWLLDIFALMLISQHLNTFLLGVLPFFSVVYYIILEDRNNHEKFGQSYEEYATRVPMMNLILGAVRYRRKS